MDWQDLLSKVRETSSKSKESVRSEFHKDYDRIVFSSAFRRLGRKTQVHPLAENDHIHTRLTHSIEVGSVGRSLGILAGNLLEDKNLLPEGTSPQEVGAIVQSASLAHDIGNPPFGHAGEFAIRHWFAENSNKLMLDEDLKKDFTLFEGNAQGFRIVTKIENNLFSGGLRLTNVTLGTLVKYPWSSQDTRAQSKEKYNFFSSEFDLAKNIFSDLGLLESNELVRHPLSFLMEAADDICYRIIDIEDALELGMLAFDNVSDIFLKISGDKAYTDPGESHTNRRRLSSLRSRAIENLIFRSFKVFEDRYDQILSGQYKGELIKDIGGLEAQGLGEAKKITQENIFLHRRKIEVELGAYTTLATIISAFVEAVNELKEGKLSFKSQRVIDLMHANRIEEHMSQHECYMRVMDYISGMTDNYATHMANQISGRAF